MRRINIYKSAIVGMLEELVAIICAFILPKMILSYFGSDYNGIIASVTQFIGCIELLKSGIGMATKNALYVPLYNHDNDRINGIMSATMLFLRRLSYIFVIGIIIFAFIYPFFIKENFTWIFTFSLVLIISLGTFFQYYFGLGNQLLLEADQKYYIISLITLINTLFNTIISVSCMKVGMGIHGVKLCSSIVYCSTPIFLHFYVNKKYNINRNAKPDWNSISKRWDAFGMQMANFVNGNTDIVIATIFLNMKEVSVYTIYYLVINGIKKIVVRISTGVESALGNLKAEQNIQKLRDNFLKFELILNFICTVLFSCLIILIVPFVKIYTTGINDVEYSRYIFSIIACLAEMYFCLRLAYTYMVQAEGAFFETKWYSYIEAIINIVASVILVNKYGLIGIVLGTLLAMIYRTVVFANYVYKNIIFTNILHFIKRLFITNICVLINSIIGIFIIMKISITNYFTWLEIASLSSIIITIITLLIYLLFDFKSMKGFLTLVFEKINKN